MEPGNSGRTITTRWIECEGPESGRNGLLFSGRCNPDCGMGRNNGPAATVLVSGQRHPRPTGGRAAGSALRVHQALKERPITSLQSVADRAGLSYHTAASGMRTLESLGVARELTGQRRGRLYGYQDYLAIMSEGTEPL